MCSAAQRGEAGARLGDPGMQQFRLAQRHRAVQPLLVVALLGIRGSRRRRSMAGWYGGGGQNRGQQPPRPLPCVIGIGPAPRENDVP